VNKANNRGCQGQPKDLWSKETRKENTKSGNFIFKSEMFTESTNHSPQIPDFSTALSTVDDPGQNALDVIYLNARRKAAQRKTNEGPGKIVPESEG